METTIIELKERNAVNDPNNNINGKFSTTTKEVILNDGDEVIVRNVFIDSKKESNTIVVETDTTLIMNFIHGITLNTDIRINNGYTGGDPATAGPGGQTLFLNKTSVSGDTSVKSSFGGFFPANNVGIGEVRGLISDGLYNRDSDSNPVNIGDTFTYFPVRKLPAPTGQMVQLDFIRVSVGNFQVRATGGGFKQLFQYIDIEGLRRNFSLNIPKVGGTNPISVDIKFPFEYILFNQDDGLEAISPSEGQLKTAEFNVEYGVFSKSTSANEVFNLVEQEISVVIPAGQYQPDILAQKINIGLNGYNRRLLTDTIDRGNPNILLIQDRRGQNIFNRGSNNLYSNVNLGGNNFYVNDNPQSAYPHTANGSNYFHMVSEDDSAVCLKVLSDLGDGQAGVAHQANNIYGGTTDFQIIFDNVTQTFKMENLHTPYYATISNVSQIGMKFNKFNVTGNGDFLTLDTKRSEIRITGLTSTGDSPDENFWFDKLGFDRSILTTTGHALKEYPGFEPGGGDATIQAPTIGGKGTESLGVTKTDAFVSGDLLIQNDKFIVDYMNNITYPILLPNTDTIAIFGTKTLNDLIVDDAYFKVIIRGNSATSNRLHDTEGVSLISALVGKYYSGESYTNGFSSDGVTYIHRGAPIVLSAFEVEILNSRNQSPTIGTDNTIILQINKNIISNNNDDGK